MTTRPRPERPRPAQCLKAGATVAVAAPFLVLSRRASAADFTYKLATGQDPSHPVNKRAQEALIASRPRTNGRLEIRSVPGEPTRLRHRPAVAGAQRRRRVLQPGQLGARDARAGGWHRQHRLCVHRLRRRSGRRWTATSGKYVRAQIEKVGPASRCRAPGTTASARSRRRRKPINDARRPERPEAARAFGADALDAVHRTRRGPDADQLQRGLFGAADQARRRPGESAGDHRDGASSTKCRSTAA